MSNKTYVPTRRSMRAAATLLVFEQRNGLWTIIEVHAIGTPKQTVYINQSQRAARNCIEYAVREGLCLIVWGSLVTTRPEIAAEELPLLALEVDA